MCAILDNNVRHEVFGDCETQTPAGKYFLDRVESSAGKLVIGGELRRELSEYGRFLIWMRTATRRNVVRSIDDKQVDDETRTLREQGDCLSNDEHVLALAKVSRTRILFTNDRDLQEDFKNSRIISNPRGQVYTTSMNRDDQQKMLSSRNIRGKRGICRYCRNPK